MPNPKFPLVQPAQIPGLALAASEEQDAPLVEDSKAEWQAQHQLDWHRAETERLKVLVEFLSNPVHAHGGSDPDPDIIVAYNLAVEAALKGIRRGSYHSNG